MHHKKHKRNRYFEDKFSIKRMMKRNKQFFDIEMIDSIEKVEKKQRRTPIYKMAELDDKIRDSFMDSTNAFSCKVDQAIENCRARVKTTILFPQSSNQSYETFKHNQSEADEKKKIHNWEKMHSRKKIIEKKERYDTCNEERYNNFYLTLYDDSHTRSFEKYPPRTSTEPAQVIENHNSVNTDKVSESI